MHNKWKICNVCKLPVTIGANKSIRTNTKHLIWTSTDFFWTSETHLSATWIETWSIFARFCLYLIRIAARKMKSRTINNYMQEKDQNCGVHDCLKRWLRLILVHVSFKKSDYLQGGIRGRFMFRRKMDNPYSLAQFIRN